MKLLEKTQANLKYNSTAKYFSECVINEFNHTQVKINKLKEIMNNISHNRKNNQAKEREELCSHLLRMLDFIESNYKQSYLPDLYDLEILLKENSNLTLKYKVQEQINIALKTKSKITTEFEIIYKNFKNIAKNLPELTQMKEILTKMRKCFYFNSNQNNNHQSNKPKYYNSTTSEIKYIF